MPATADAHPAADDEAADAPTVSKEELQTVNQENRRKVEELGQLSGDLQNLLAATDIATLFLDRDLRILRFTPQVGELFNVRWADRGRPLSDLTHRLGYADLLGDARRVLSRLAPVEREVQDDDGRWYLTRVLPYRTPEDRIEGVVLTFTDITARVEAEADVRAGAARVAYRAALADALRPLRDPAAVVAEAALRESEERFRQVAEAVPDVLFTTGPDGTIDYVSAHVLALTGAAPADVVGTVLWPDLIHPDDRERAAAAWEAAVREQERYQVRYRLRNEAGGYCWVIVRARPAETAGGSVRW